MSLAKLVVHLQSNYKGLVSGLKIARENLSAFSASVRASLAHLDSIRSANRDLESTGQLPAEHVDLLNMRLGAMATNLEKVSQQYRQYVRSFENKIVAIELAKQAQKQDDIRKLWNSSRSALIRYNAEASQTARRHSDLSADRVRPAAAQPPRARSNLADSAKALIPVAATVVQVKALTTLQGTLQKTERNVAAMTQVSATAASTMDRFRIAVHAPKTDPSLNVLKNGVDGLGRSVANVIETLRGRADSTVMGFGGTVAAVATAISVVAMAIDRSSATLTKWSFKLGNMSAAGNIAKKVFFPFARIFDGFANTAWFKPLQEALAKLLDLGAKLLAQMGPLGQEAAAALQEISNEVRTSDGTLQSFSKIVQNVGDKFDNMNGKLGAAKNLIGAVGYVATGTFTNLGSTADIGTKAMKYAVMPVRLLYREWQGFQRVGNASKHVVSALAAPIRMTSNYIAQMKVESGLLNDHLKDQPAAYRNAARGLWFLSSLLRPPIAGMIMLGQAVVPVARGLMVVARPAAKCAVALKNVAVNALAATAKITGVGAVAGAAAGAFKWLTAAASDSGTTINSKFTVAKGPLSGLLTKAAMLKTAMVAAAGSAIMWGGSVAIATETAQTQFGTLLRDMDQGKAVIAQISQFSAETPFQNEELREAARLLLTAQVPADQLTDKLRILGDIAAGTGQPIQDMAAIYQKVQNTGKFGLEQINQFAERGVPILQALQDSLGVTRDELMGMVSAGKLGPAEMESALQNLATGQGVFAGGMANLSQTTAGLWSTLKDNVGIALENLVSIWMGSVKTMLTWAITITQRIGDAFLRLQPVITGVISVVRAMFTTVWRAIGSVAEWLFGKILNSGVFTFENLIAAAVQMLAMSRWMWSNLGTVAQYAWVGIKLAGIVAFNTLMFAGGALLNWFADNWRSVFSTMGNFALAVVNNLVTNLGSAFATLWDWIKSGGTKALEFAFLPMLEGFKATVSQLPDLANRATTALEDQLTAERAGLQSTMAEGMAQSMADAAKSAAADLAKSTTAIPVKPLVADQSGSAVATDEMSGQQSGGGKQDNTPAVKGSREAVAAIFAAMRQKEDMRTKLAEKQLKEQQKQTAATLALNTRLASAQQIAVIDSL